MERITGLFGGPSRLLGGHRGEDFVVRSQRRVEPYEIEAQFHKSQMVVPITTPIYEGDIVERGDPRGGVIEYTVANVELSRDPFGHGNDHAIASLKENGHAERKYGSVYNIHVAGGNNQIAAGANATLNQTVNAVNDELAAVLRAILADVPRDALSSSELEELEEAIGEAIEVSESGSAKPTAVKRALYSAKGVVEDLGSAIKSGTGDAVRSWATTAVTVLLTKLSGM
ncbi:hypothetical protein E3T55_16085 [Cryobacterium frigoriphilum]|uniref:Uncharacterized protein n=1 Tax=Cryobacterium frigoriphilum TaxID=1259150 RepID=A0A4R8ZUS4_9MICO|nr:hypothetical protein [Cryobacterium frigoriphilum]TFD46895.1 hypothetical protein E3T55_16085 [Cryobacterium frigoriphilum]